MMGRMTRMAVVTVVLGLFLTPIGAAALDFTLEFHNDTQNKGVALLYQQPPSSNFSSAPVAWQTATVRSGKMTTFLWSDDYQVSLSESHEITVGSIYEPTATLSVAYGSGTGVQVGEWFISQTSQGGSIPPGWIQVVTPAAPYPYLVGIGISGKPAIVVELQPNMQWNYLPTYTYRVAFGSFTEGMILNADMISDSIEVTFSEVTTKCVVTLLNDGTMKVSK